MKRPYFSKLLIWLLADLGLLAAFWLCRGNRVWMNRLAAQVTTPLRQALGRLCFRVHFSVMEVLCGLLALVTVMFLLRSIAAVVRARGRRLRRTSRAALTALCAGLTIYAGFCFLWGVDYYTDSVQLRSGIHAQPVEQQELESVARYFADRLAETAGGVPRNPDGTFAADRADILAFSPHVYDALEQQLPFLTFDDTGVKPVRFSHIMSLLDFTGIYCPFTGEPNVNMESPACMLPATAAHEMAHQRSVASEQECNFLAVLAATTCGDPAYAYSGWLLGYVHLGNALHRADPEAWQSLWDSLPGTVQTDIRNNNAYWRSLRETPVKTISNEVYDRFLKSYGQPLGRKTYGTVVDLLVVYYREAAAAVR